MFPASSPRVGVLGQASLLAMNAHAATTSPTLRGKFVRQVLLCEAIPPPPANVNTTLPDTGTAQTTRQKVEQHSTNPTCAACHKLMDPVGLALENFDAIGRFRDTENGHAIDASGELDGVQYTGPAGLAQAIAGHPNLPSCFVRTLYRQGSGTLEAPEQDPLIAALTGQFSTSGYQLRAFLGALVNHDFRSRTSLLFRSNRKMPSFRLTRRHMLRGALGGVAVGVALPLLDLMHEHGAEAAAATAPRRFVVFFWGNGRGVVASRWTPATTGAGYQLSPQLAPLAPVKDYVNVVTNFDVKIGSDRGHHRGSVGMLSGDDFISQDAGGSNFRSTFKSPSIDQVAAAQIGTTTPFKSLELRISEKAYSNEGTTCRYISHNGPDNANPGEHDPSVVFNRLFTGNQGPSQSTQLDQARTRSTRACSTSCSRTPTRSKVA